MQINERKLKRIIREEVEATLSGKPDLTSIVGDGDEGLAGSIMKGLSKGAKRFIMKKGLKKFLIEILEFAFKSVPIIGNIASIADLGATALMLIKDTKDFTDDLLKISKVELSGIRSLLGEYSIFDASAEDMKKVAVALRQNMTEEQRKVLAERWDDIMDDMKELVINVILIFKEFTAGLAVPVLFATKLLPVEVVAKELLFKVAKMLNDQPEAVQLFIRAMSYLDATQLVPIIGFLRDYDRVRAFIEIDNVITESADSSREYALRAAQSVTSKGTDLWKLAGTVGDEFADSVASGFKLESRRDDRILMIEAEVMELERRRLALRG